MEDKRIVGVPSDLYASKTKDTLSKSAVNEINAAMRFVFMRLRKDRDFPLRIKLLVNLDKYGDSDIDSDGTSDESDSELLTMKNAEIVRKKFEVAGYNAKIESGPTLILSQPNSNKKQKLDEPPAYD